MKPTGSDLAILKKELSDAGVTPFFLENPQEHSKKWPELFDVKTKEIFLQKRLVKLDKNQKPVPAIGIFARDPYVFVLKTKDSFVEYEDGSEEAHSFGKSFKAVIGSLVVTLYDSEAEESEILDFGVLAGLTKEETQRIYDQCAKEDAALN